MKKRNGEKPLYQNSFAYTCLSHSSPVNLPIGLSLNLILSVFLKQSHQIVDHYLRPTWSTVKFAFSVLLAIFFFLLPQNSEARQLSVNNELFVEIPEMIVPIVQRREVAGFFSITLALDCPNKTITKRVEKFLPIIRDRFFWDLYILLGVIWSSDFRTDVKELKQRLKKRIDQILGKNVVSDVLVLSFQKHERKNVDRN